MNKKLEKHKSEGLNKKKYKYGLLLKGFFIGICIFLIVLILIAFGLYKSGEISLKNSAESTAPKVSVSQADIESAREKFEYVDTIPWQDDWIVHNEKIYEYKEDTLNFLLLGIDQRGKLDSETDLSDWEAGQADAVFVVSLHPEEKKVSVIGIPRNAMTYIEMFGEEQQSLGYIYNQVCLQYGYAGGGKLGLETTNRAVSEMLYNLPIHGTCAINFEAIGIVTDMIGGVEVTIKEDLSILGSEYTVGNQVVIKGDNTVDYLIYRDTSVLGSPTTRLTREKEFLQAMINKSISCVKSNPSIVKDVYNAIMPYMNTDITLDKAVYLAVNSLDYSVDGKYFYQLQGKDVEVTGIGEFGEERTFNDLYLDEDYLLETVVKIFYKEVNYNTSNQ